MPGWNLWDTRSCQLVNKALWRLSASLVLLIIAISGCTRFTPGALQDLLNNKPQPWRSEATAPDDFYLAPDAQEALNSLQQDDSADGKVKKPSILPEIDPAEIAAMNEGISDSAVNENERDNDNFSEEPSSSPKSAASEVVQEVPAAGLMAQPLRPLTFDHQSRKRIVDDVQSLRQDDIIRLTAEASANPLASPPPQVGGAENDRPAESMLPLEPSMPPLQIVDARYMPDPSRTVELPVPGMAMGESHPAGGSMNSQAATQFESTSNDAILRPVQPAQDFELADSKLRPGNDMTPSFANFPSSAEPAVDDNPVNDFELPASQQPPNLVVDSESTSNEFAVQAQPVNRIGSHSDDDAAKVDVGASLTAQELKGSVVGAGASLAEPPAVQPASPKKADQGLRLVNAVFCTSVSGYGQFDAFETNRFGPNQHLLVYCEIENFRSVKDDTDGLEKFVTRLRGSYTIHDADGKTVDRYEFPVVEDTARNQRRDFYVHLPVQLGDFQPGRYSIQLNIDDLNGNSSANLANPLEFDVIQ